MASPPRMKPTKNIGEVDETDRDPALRHERAGEHEEGDGQQREIVDAVRHFQKDRLKRNADIERRRHRREPERIGDRHVERDQQKEAADQKDRPEFPAHQARTAGGVDVPRSAFGRL